MLQINNLTITTNKGRVLVDGFSFVLNDGDKIALIGEEGNGKSTLLKAIMGYDLTDYVSVTGSVYCDGKIGYLPQRIEEQWLDSTPFEFLVKNSPDEEIDYNSYDDYDELGRIFARIGIPAELLSQDRSLKTFSGGEKVKLALAKLVYEKCDMLLLDEPTNDLDLKTLLWLEEFIKNQNSGIIFISHDEALLEACSNGIIHLEQLKRKQQSKISYAGMNYSDYVEMRAYNINRNNMIARKEKAQLNKKLERYRQIYEKVEYRQNTISRGDPHGAALLKKKMHNLKAQGRNLDEQKKNLTELIEPEEAINIFFDEIKPNPNKIVLDYHLRELVADDKVLSKNIELFVKGKDKVCIIGDNGSGKTTLIKLLLSELRNKSNLRIGYMPQNYLEVMDYSLTPVDFLLENVDYSYRGKLQSYLGSLKFTTEEMKHKIEGLSEGQKCKLLIVKMIIDGCELLVMDEPTRNLSPLSNPKIREILNDYKGCIISVSHDRKFIEEVCDKVYELTDKGLELID